MWILYTLLLTISFKLGDFLETVPIDEIVIPKNISDILNETRRILRGSEVEETRPYMVYIRPAAVGENANIKDNTWLCGGVIIHERYILTSAACIEQAQHFYVISGTWKWLPSNESNECIKYGAKKAVWKCVPKNYVFDGAEYDNIRWMIYDIAVVKVEEDFNFQRRIKGCDYVPKMIAYNNHSLDFEKAGTLASTAGWGSKQSFSDDVGSPSLRALKISGAENSPTLLETEVILISKKNCKKRWPDRYHHIIEEHMICGKDGLDGDTMSSVCSENEVNCKELNYSDEYSDEEENKKPKKRARKTRRMIVDPSNNDVEAMKVGRTNGELLEVIKNDARRAKANKVISSGFCENDHGGPLVVGHGQTSMVVGVISACQTRKVNRKCFGPFLYTSVYKNRNLIACAINKEIGATCRNFLRSTDQTAFDWSNHPDGPAKEEVEQDVTISKENQNAEINAQVEAAVPEMPVIN